MTVTLYQFLRIVEIRTKIVSASAFVVGTLFAVYRGASVDVPAALLLLGALLLVDMGTTAFNTFFDFYRGVDTGDTNRERDKVLVHENVAPGLALMIAVALFALSAIPGIFLAVRVSWLVIVVGIAGMAVGYTYNGGPLPLSRTPLGELFAGGFLGYAVVILSYAIHARTVDTFVLIAAIPHTFMVASILTVNNSCDRLGDAASGRRTVSILLGARGTVVFFAAQQVLGWGLVAVFVLSGLLPFRGLLVLIPCLVAAGIEYGAMARRGFSHATKMANMASISRIFLLYTATLVGSVSVGLL